MNTDLRGELSCLCSKASGCVCSVPSPSCTFEQSLTLRPKHTTLLVFLLSTYTQAFPTCELRGRGLPLLDSSAPSSYSSVSFSLLPAPLINPPAASCSFLMDPLLFNLLSLLSCGCSFDTAVTGPIKDCLVTPTGPLTQSTEPRGPTSQPHTPPPNHLIISLSVPYFCQWFHFPVQNRNSVDKWTQPLSSALLHTPIDSISH